MYGPRKNTVAEAWVLDHRDIGNKDMLRHVQFPSFKKAVSHAKRNGARFQYRLQNIGGRYARSGAWHSAESFIKRFGNRV